MKRRRYGADVVICAWGQHGELHGCGEAVRKLLEHTGKLHYLKLTRVHPHHPLYLRGDAQPIRWAL